MKVRQKNGKPAHHRVVHRIASLPRHRYHPLLHRAHNEHRISYRTLYYIKSFGDDRHLWHAIVRQSVKILLLASILSSIGGLWLASVESRIIAMTPLLILLPALAGMIGNFGTVISSKFSVMLYFQKVPSKWWRAPDVRSLVASFVCIGLLASVYIGILASVFALAQGFPVTLALATSVLVISVVSTMALIGIICAVAFVGGLAVFRRGEDPNNFLIPMTTSVADFGSLILFSVLAAALI